MEIPNIFIPNNSIRISDIRDVNINVMPDWMTNPPQALPIYPPVTTQVGIPIAVSYTHLTLPTKRIV